MSYLFEENQKFTQWWIWIFLLFGVLSLVVSINNSYTLLIGFLVLVFFYFFVYANHGGRR